MAPSSQFEKPSEMTADTMSTLMTMTPALNTWKSKVMGTSIAQASNTEKGTTNSAICVEDPTAMPIARSILSFAAAVTAVVCSTALPTMGSRTTPTKVLGTPTSTDMPCKASTSSCELRTAATTTKARTAREPPKLSSGSSSSSRSCPVKRCTCVFSWNTRKSTYMEVRTMALILEAWRTLCSSTSEAKLYIVGSISAMELSRRHETLDWAPFRLNPCSLNQKPPTRNAVPRTSRRLESTEPRSEPCTTLIMSRSGPTAALCSACHVTIISIALPKVALSRPPSKSPVCAATASVAAPMMPAMGTSAAKLSQKMAVSPQPW
mmetsp:Transcript_121387/g.377769  ORF Transcript_121387/g.377769 Transcript_121387/m.377769 type:complete len:321 (-) Transcript_121387:247-1209(-)